MRAKSAPPAARRPDGGFFSSDSLFELSANLQ
jgi:hypothetical protein